MRKVFLIFLSFSIAFAKGECEELVGLASWYGGKFHGRKTSSGEVFNKYKYTAASNVFPLDTYVLVKNLENGKEVVVRITDRGPFKKGRILDLSKASAEKLGMVNKGVVRVEAIPLYCVADAEKLEEQDYIQDIINTF